jgi:hypothetical protein
MDLTKARIGQEVRTLRGRGGRIATLDRSGYITIEDDVGGYTANIDGTEPIAPDACESCQHIAILRKDRDNWKAVAQAAKRNSAYWREELTKLQKEALSECKPLGEVAKIYIQISPAVLASLVKDGKYSFLEE